VTEDDTPEENMGTAVDPELLLGAERVLERHRPHVAEVGRPQCEYCAEAWPCPSAMAAQQAAMLAGGPHVALADVPVQRPPGDS
jgi:hypothetical protein